MIRSKVREDVPPPAYVGTRLRTLVGRPTPRRQEERRAMLSNPNEAAALPHRACARDGGAFDARPSGTRLPVLVEFLGTPGSGKTTVCAAVVAELSRDGFAVITRDEYFAWMYGPRHKKLEYLLAGGFRTMYFAADLFYFLCRTSTRRGRSLFKAAYELVCMQAWLSTTLRRRADCPVILDEFACNRFVYRLHDASLTARLRSNLVRLLFLFYPRCSAHWILKTVPIATAAQRIVRRPLLNNRAPKPIETLPAARERAVLIQHTQMSQFIFDAIQSRFGAHAHVVDGSQPVETQVRHALDILTALLNEGETVNHASV